MAHSEAEIYVEGFYVNSVGVQDGEWEIKGGFYFESKEELDKFKNNFKKGMAATLYASATHIVETFEERAEREANMQEGSERPVLSTQEMKAAMCRGDVKDIPFDVAAHVVQLELSKNKGLWESYKANIAMAFFDEHRKESKNGRVNRDELHKIANDAAENFLTLLCKD